MKALLKKLKTNTGGLNRLVAVFLIAIAVMLVIIAIPAFNAFRFESERSACDQAMKSVQDGLIIDYLGSYKNSTLAEAQLTIDEVMPGREENVCPAGGTVYLVEGEKGVYKPVCGLHDRDTKERTRLNASYAMQHLENRLNKLKKQDQEIPDPVVIQINGKDLEIVRTDVQPAILSGTSASIDYDGIVSFYGLDDKGKISFFVYADEDHCANWSLMRGWGGDAYK